MDTLKENLTETQREEILNAIEKCRTIKARLQEKGGSHEKGRSRYTSDQGRQSLCSS
jgi:hypothetical protein